MFKKSIKNLGTHSVENWLSEVYTLSKICLFQCDNNFFTVICLSVAMWVNFPVFKVLKAKHLMFQDISFSLTKHSVSEFLVL